MEEPRSVTVIRDLEADVLLLRAAVEFRDGDAVRDSPGDDEGMQKAGVIARLYPAIWGALIVALCASVTVWGFGLNASLESGVPGTAPVPPLHGPPRIVTVNPDLGLPYIAKLCAEISPSPKTITIESVGGTILSTSPC
jgi:hypothetical protein